MDSTSPWATCAIGSTVTPPGWRSFTQAIPASLRSVAGARGTSTTRMSMRLPCVKVTAMATHRHRRPLPQISRGLRPQRHARPLPEHDDRDVVGVAQALDPGPRAPDAGGATLEDTSSNTMRSTCCGAEGRAGFHAATTAHTTATLHADVLRFQPRRVSIATESRRRNRRPQLRAPPRRANGAGGVTRAETSSFTSPCNVRRARSFIATRGEALRASHLIALKTSERAALELVGYSRATYSALLFATRVAEF